METPKQQNNKLIGWVIFIAAAVLILALFGKQDDHNKCVERAEQAAIDTYDISTYPNTAERSALQERYKQSYISGSCR